MNCFHRSVFHIGSFLFAWIIHADLQRRVEHHPESIRSGVKCHLSTGITADLLNLHKQVDQKISEDLSLVRIPLLRKQYHAHAGAAGNPYSLTATMLHQMPGYTGGFAWFVPTIAGILVGWIASYFNNSHTI